MLHGPLTARSRARAAIAWAIAVCAALWTAPMAHAQRVTRLPPTEPMFATPATHLAQLPSGPPQFAPHGAPPEMIGPPLGTRPATRAARDIWSPHAAGPHSTPSGGTAPWLEGPHHNTFALQPSYRYNGGGGYLHIASPQEQYVINVQNQLTLDGTFFNRPNMPTDEKGFNMPFTRTYLFGNITESWQYQVATQSFLGQFNILDCFINWHISDELNIRFGRGLSPMLYEYYAFSPAWEPVITNSVLFQLAGKRQQGVMVWGNIFDGTVQYQAGVFNGVSGAFYDLDRSVDFIGSLAYMPWAGTGTIFENMGFGVSTQTGQHNYALNQTGSAFTNGAGEPTTNINYITSSGIPFFQYNLNTWADGNQTKFAPQFFWFGRFSVLAEYLYCTRQLASGNVAGTAVQHGFYVNTSYFLTGEHYQGNGLAGYTTIEPLRPFGPAQGHLGPGAWELAAQFSQLYLDDNNFRFVNNPDQYASRLDQLMVGVNWWPNRYVRFSADNVFTWFDRSIPLGTNANLRQFNTAWVRAAMFF